MSDSSSIDKQSTSMEQMYNTALANSWVQMALAQYDSTKHSCSFLENTLGKAENLAVSSSQAVYNKANNVYDSYYVQPKHKIGEVYSTGVEKTKYAIETSKNVAVKTSTVGIGAAVVATQLGLALTAGGASLFLDSLNAGKTAGTRVIVTMKEYERAVEKRIWNVIHETQRLAMLPVDKLSDTANSMLDVVYAMAERSLGISIEVEDESTVAQRVRALAGSIVGALTNKAHSDVIDPLNLQLKTILEHLSKSFVIVDLVRSKREWALEKAEELSQSVSDLKQRFEQEAAEYKTQPEVILMKSIRASAKQLEQKLVTLKQKGNQLLGNGNSVEGAINYLQELEKQLAQADNIYDVRDEVLSEARQRLGELTAWTTSLVMNKRNEEDDEEEERDE